MADIRPLLPALTQAVVNGVQECFDHSISPEQVQLQNTRKEFEGSFTVVVFPFVKAARKSPEQTGQHLGDYLVEHVPELTGFNVVKGFLNLTVSEQYWLTFLERALADAHFGYGQPASKPLVMVEYSSPNTNKPLHLGHLRNNFLGYAVAEILRAFGHEVKKVQIVNDRGIHICKSMVAWQRFGAEETPASSGMKGDHLVGKYYVAFDRHYKQEVADLVEAGSSQEEAEQAAPLMQAARETLLLWEQKDPETIALWRKMNGWVYDGFDATYREMGVDFDKLYYESDTYLTGKSVVEEGLEKGVFFRKEDGSVWVDLTENGLDQKLLLRRDGTAVYMTQDIGTAILRFKDFPGLSYQIYTVGNEQEYHFKVLFHILAKLGVENAEKNYHLSYGMVALPEGKMKSREGTVVDADDLMREMRETAAAITQELGKLDGVSDAEKSALHKTIGYGSLKYFLLKVDPRKGMQFNPQESVDFSGNTGSYLQYQYVRTRALMRKYNRDTAGPFDVTELTGGERELLHKLHDFPDVLEEAATTYNPSVLCNYAYELVKAYSSFYQANPILDEQAPERTKFRVALSQKMGEVLRSAMEPLGIEMPERM